MKSIWRNEEHADDAATMRAVETVARLLKIHPGLLRPGDRVEKFNVLKSPLDDFEVDDLWAEVLRVEGASDAALATETLGDVVSLLARRSPRPAPRRRRWTR